MKEEYKMYPEMKLKRTVYIALIGIGIYLWTYYMSLSEGLDISFWEFVKKTYFVLILVVVGFFKFRLGEQVSITKEYLKYDGQKYEWTNIKSVRWAHVYFEPGEGAPERVLMIEQRKISEDEEPVSEYLDNVECLSPMDPKCTIEIALLNFSDKDIKTFERTIHFHTMVYPEIKTPLEIKL